MKSERLFILFIGAIVGVAFMWSFGAPPPSSPPMFTANDQVIEALPAHLDLEDEMAVFRHVLTALGDEVTVYPSENYLYFRFPAAGHMIWGSITLTAATRDDGVLGFGYTSKPANAAASFTTASPGGGGAYGPDSGVSIERVSDFVYDVSFEDQTVRFKLFDVGTEPPASGRMRADEIAISPLMDESGLAFHLLFNRTGKRLYLILNPALGAGEEYQNLTDDISIGLRSGFAYFEDSALDRRVLIGVEGANVLANNWYDGPFDQMPDNNIKLGRIPGYRDFLTAHYPTANDRVDEYGRYLDRPGSRVAVAPYLVYFDKRQLVARVARCRAENGGENSEAAGHVPAEFYSCLTEQVFDLPDHMN